MPLAPADAPETVARVHEGMPVVDAIAHQLLRELGAFNLDDLRSAGHEGLLQAARSYDPALGVPFRRWVAVRVRGAMLDSLRTQTDLPRLVHARLRAIEAGDRMSEAAAEEETAPTSDQEADARLSSYLAGLATAIATGFLGTATRGNAVGDQYDVVDPGESADERLGRERGLAQMHEAIAAQPEAERRLLTRYYLEGVKFEAVADEMGLSKSWLSRLHVRAIEGVTRELKKRRAL